MYNVMNPSSPQFVVVRNQQQRLSLWPASKAVPVGWTAISDPCSKEECERVLRTGGETGPQQNEAESGAGAGAEKQAQRRMVRNMDVGLMFFGDNEYSSERNRYDFLLECASYADQHGLSAIWLPERHFTKFGCLFPSPAVLHAALARETERIRLRAGSVVMPLNDPIRVAEQWAVVDNLSNGRVDVSFASGWHPNDFVLAPDKYESRYDCMYEGIQQVQRYWRGETCSAVNGKGESVDVRIYPTPIQASLPIWLTAATSPQTFIRAGELGFNVITHLFDQQVDQLAKKIALYRQARVDSGRSARGGTVTVTLHAFMGETLDDVREHARMPYRNYLKSNLSLLKNLAISRGMDVEIDRLGEEQIDQMIDFMFEKFLGGRSLLGTPESCLEMARQLSEIGVDELACLVDFGPSTERILGSLPHLAALAQAMRSQD
jgi:phthiocerol/phenolphthiocerol synthesis type-I polyketide synthase D